MASPNSFRDPYWSDLAVKAAKKVDVPPDLLVSILTNGERSNANQKSEAGAQTVFQIIPETRDRILKRDGIDAYLSDENAAVAAALTLKDGVRWAQTKTQDPAAVNKYAAGYYHAGGNTKNWGPRTAAYVSRVSKGLGQQPAPAEDSAQPSTPTQSTFDRVMAQMRPAESSIKTAFQAYQSGQMEPQDAAAFENEVSAGRIMLPPGTSLKTAQGSAPQAAGQLPPAILEAYNTGRMSPEDKAQVDELVKSGLVAKPQRLEDLIPVEPGANTTLTPQADPTLVERVIGAGEAGLSTITGLTGGALGMAGGTVKGLAGAVMDGTYGTQQGVQNVERAAAQGAEALTYQPRTQQGQAQTQAIGGALQQALPVMPLTGELQLLARAGATAAPAVGATVRAGGQQAKQAGVSAGQAVGNAAAGVAQRARAAVGMDSAPAPSPAGGAMGGSVGAAGTQAAQMRTATANTLPVKIDLTRGAVTRDAAQLAFEKEQIKAAEFGAPLRERAELNNKQILDNFEAFLDQTGAVAPDTYAASKSVVDSLASGLASAKNRTRVAYAKADTSPEALAPVTLDDAVAHLNSKPAGLNSTKLLDDARSYAVKMGIAAKDADGNLVPLQTTLKNAEAWRKEVSGATGFEPVDIRDATILKNLTDQATESVSGPLYRQARALRRRQAEIFEDRAIVSDLITNRKGMADPKVAIDKVFNRAVLNGSAEELRFLKRVLQTQGGEAGKQAWKELQGAAVNYIREHATAMPKDSMGRDTVTIAGMSRAIEALDKNGRLDILFTKKGAEQMRTLNEVAAYVTTVPPGTLINNSGTAGTLLAAIAEAGATGAATGLPLPVVSGMRQLSKMIKDRKLQKRVNQSLINPYDQ